MQPRYVDLHTHTTASDGSDSPSELVAKADALGIAALAVTDHDTLSGLDEAVAEGRRRGLEVIRGCELSVSSAYGEVHILGLWLPEDVGVLEQRLVELRARRNQRNDRILERLESLGLPVLPEELLAETGGESVGRPHIALAMTRKGYTSTPQQAFREFLGKGGAAFVPKDVMEPGEGVRLLASLGATVSIAHPMLLRCPPDWLDTFIGELRREGLTAIEAYHTEHSPRDERLCAEFAARHQLQLTGGSDYHGAAKPLVRLGRGKGALRVTEAVLDQLKQARLRRGLPV